MRLLLRATSGGGLPVTLNVRPMRTLYLIFSHDNQKQLARLAATIRKLSPKSVIVIHHDPGIAILDVGLFAGIEGVYFVPDAVHGEWGDFSLVQQYLHAFRWCADNLQFDWLVTLTGLSYPVMPLDSFERFLDTSAFDAFLYHFDAFDPSHWPEGTGATRYLFYYFKLPRNPYYYKVPARLRTMFGNIRVAFNKSQPIFRIIPMPRGARTRLGIRRFTFPFGKKFAIQGGQQMLNINRRALTRILNYIRDNPRYLTYSTRTIIPDESFFTSIIANDAGLKVRNDVLRYIKWPSGKAHAASVTIITSDEVDAILHSGSPFALKFDSRVDASALDLIDISLALTTDRESMQKTV